ncbi:MAG: hypothetical protein K6A37_01385 [Saccharofermentans sp.]|nr:hypothetical protein [Saccharofermentans sp.]
MAAMAETSGPSSRCRLLVEGFAKAGAEVATCRAEDVNFKPFEGIRNFFLDVPMPMGLPSPIAKRMFPIAQKTGITARKKVDSFDQVLFMTGNLDYGYIKKSVDSVRIAIKEFHTDIVYSEFNISAMIAARIEGVPLCCTVSYPTQHEYANKPGLAKGLNRYLEEEGLSRVDSALKLFDLADKSFCTSIPELEPIEKPDVTFCGTLKEKRDHAHTGNRDKIVVYMGNGTVSAGKMKQVITEAFARSKYEVFIASSYLEKEDAGNIHIAPRWDFDELLEEAVLFINHGGQNSMMDGLIHGVPQIVVPGKVFERKYNAGCIEKNNAGALVPAGTFTVDVIRNEAQILIGSEEIRDNARRLGAKLLDSGGAQTILREILM